MDYTFFFQLFASIYINVDAGFLTQFPVSGHFLPLEIPFFPPLNP